MTRLDQVSWITDADRAELVKHNILTLQELAVFETTDSTARTVNIHNLRAKARRARRSLGLDDPFARIGAAAGQRANDPVAYAGGKTYGGD